MIFSVQVPGTAAEQLLENVTKLMMVVRYLIVNHSR